MEKQKQTNLEKYGVESYSQTEECKEQSRQTKLERYGDEKYNNLEKQKQTCLDKYGKESYMQTDEFKEKSKDVCLDRYGAENYAQTDEFKEKFKNSEWVKGNTEKIYQTKKKNHSFNSSAIEEEFANYLKENNIKFERQYRSEEYPFNCDFYLSDYNIYVEIQGNWNHGKHPYNREDENDNKVLSDWVKKSIEHPYYLSAIDVWTKRDVRKREIAKKNNLNYLEIFSINIEECKKSINKFIFNLNK